MIVLSNRFDRLDEYIAEAAMGHCSWTDALSAMAPLVGADGLSMDLMFGDNRMVRSLGAVGFDQSMIQAYADHYHRIDPRIIYAQRYASHGVIFDEELRRPENAAEHREFWEWLERCNAPTEASVLVMPCVGDTRIGLAVHRAKSSSDHTDLVQFYQRFYDKFNAVNTLLRLKPKALNGIHPAAYPLRHIDSFAFDVDEDLRLSLPDDVTDPILGYRLAMTGFAQIDEEGILRDLLPDFQAALATMLQNAFPQAGVELTRKTLLADTILRVAPLPQTASLRAVKVSATYLRHQAEAEKVFMGSFGLTRRQAELLNILRRVDALDEAATTMGISRNTARVFLAQIFERTGIRRKADLLRLADNFA
jgi:DNA-binding CsgD family transcriptional regulator